MEKGIPIFAMRGHGKLLLTGEYVVLDGAASLAVPLRYGQDFVVWEEPSNAGVLRWEALDREGKVWFSSTLDTGTFQIIASSDAQTASRLRAMLVACRDQSPDFLAGSSGYRVETRLDFDRAWGFGTSSTLIAALSAWAGADPYRVLRESLGGSGYDIACATAQGPLVYRLLPGGAPTVEPVDFRPPFSDKIYFVYLGKKQDSREGIRRYRAMAADAPELVGAISAITREVLRCTDLAAFDRLILEHERLIGEALGLPLAGNLHFPDYPWGVVKSLGAWGGDFVMVTGGEEEAVVRNYFEKKGFFAVFSWEELVLTP